MSLAVMTEVITNKTLYQQLRLRSKRFSATTHDTIDFLFDYVYAKVGVDWDSEDEERKNKLKNHLKGYHTTLIKKWKQVKSIEEKFLRKNERWLNNKFHIPKKSESIQLDQRKKKVDINKLNTRCGRPVKVFSDSSERTKLRKTEKLRMETPPEEIIFATKTVLHSMGKRAAADVLTDATQNSPTRPVKMRKVLRDAKTDRKKIISYTVNEALAFFINNKLTKQTYHYMRLEAKRRNANIYPSYDKIRAAKKQCYPEGIIISETGASVPLQNLMNHTVEKLLQTIQLSANLKLAEKHIELFCKWGCDGSSSYNEYMQLFHESKDSSSSNISTETVFMFSMVPLVISAKDENAETSVLWKNPRPSSTRYCRPIKFKYVKETKVSTKEEVKQIEEEISKLQPYKIEINEEIVNINFSLQMTMVDTKVINVLAESSSQRCYICGCYPKDMNNLEKIRTLPICEENLQYGLSTLHAWIKFLECILHISYKLEMKVTSVRGKTAKEKEEMEDRKAIIKNLIWKALGIKVDKVVQGKGTSNTGNVSRRFFAEPKKAAAATGVDEQLISRFSTILTVLSSGYEINTEKFDAYAKETAKLYVKLYSWYKMPPSVHKVLLHGSIVIKKALVPIGHLSEEAQESRNKDYRYFRTFHTRKTSQLNVTTDIMHNLLISSDPVIAVSSPQKPLKRKAFTSETLNLLKVFEIDEESSENSDLEFDAN